jgi:hypothetical protein
MIQTIDKKGFTQAFREHGRGEQFSYAALGVLFDYFEEYEESTGEQIELDVVAICCEYSEESYKDIAAFFDIDLEDLTDKKAKQAVMDFLCDVTTVIGETENGTFVYQQF